ncbi:MULTISPECIES: acyl-CoA reductase [Croceibacter]|uniref:acyl-CoA reductase n=1 Tax=Croceibacter TaxID=216431 RepID=UPI000C3DB0D4|nr:MULTISPECIES: acyl-CoA reductase [Croceibacter]MBG24696.1 acyl-CoA reductase [Croceibacter sp.]|tara:strand:+ start:1747 stop:2790 length:1044 start_codon:yes stop_codon:yes gene_type:complete
MTLNEHIEAFSELGKFLEQFFNDSNTKDDEFSQRLATEIEAAVHYNGWFTKNNVRFSLQQWQLALTEDNLSAWLKNYNINTKAPKTIGLILAGNVPLVGFHDVLSVLVTGHNVLIKYSSNDQRLLPLLLEKLKAINTNYNERIKTAKDQLKGFDAVIATGSNNTSRYFNYYFKNVPSIIRKNRHSVAILTGEESPEQIQLLANDIFRYYGLGCRNVSKLLVPEGYNFNTFFENIMNWSEVINDNKYANNYDYNKAVYLMSGANMLDNNFVLLKEDKGFSSPIGVLFQDSYKNLEELEEILAEEKDNLQCVVSNNLQPHHIYFGETQHPKLWDYADNIDTVEFLLKVN